MASKVVFRRAQTQEEYRLVWRNVAGIAKTSSAGRKVFRDQFERLRSSPVSRPTDCTLLDTRDNRQASQACDFCPPASTRQNTGGWPADSSHVGEPAGVETKCGRPKRSERAASAPVGGQRQRRAAGLAQMVGRPVAGSLWAPETERSSSLPFSTPFRFGRVCEGSLG